MSESKESNLIKVRCPECRAKLDVKQKYAGGKVKCPGCDTKIEVPLTAAIPAPKSSSLAARSGSGSGKVPLPKPKAKPPAEIMPPSGAFRADDGVPVDDFMSLLSHDGPCPSCSAPWPADSVICVKCGYNKTTGTKLSAKPEAPAAARPAAAGGNRKLLLIGGGAGLLLLIVVVLTFALRGGGGAPPPDPQPEAKSKPKKAPALPAPTVGDPKGGDAKVDPKVAATPKDDPDPDPKDTPPADPKPGREVAPSVRVNLPPFPVDGDPDADKSAPVDAGLSKLEETLAAGSDTDKQRAMEIRHERESWVESYDAIGRRNTTWNDAARKALNWMVRSAVGRPDKDHDADDVAWAAARRALAAGCDDPLIHFVYLKLALRYTHGGPPEAIKARYVQALLETADALRGSNYPATRRCEAYATAAPLFRFRERKEDSYLDRILNPAHDALRAAVKEGPRPACAMLDLLDPLLDNDPEYKVLHRQRTYDNWQTLISGGATQAVFRGRRQLAYAWLLYGDGTKEMSPADKKLLVTRLDGAEDTLGKAWEAAQAVPSEGAAVARVMLAVMTGQGRGADRFDTWYRRAAEDERNLPMLYRAKLMFLSPKWQGAADGHDLINFGRDSVRMPHMASRSPLVLVEAHAMLAKAAPDPAAEAAYFRNPIVWEDLKSAYQPYLEAFPKDRAARSAFAFAAARAAQWVEANRQFELLGDKPRLDAFEGKRETYDRLRQTAKAEAARLSG